MQEDDYIMRQINGVAKVLAKFIGKEAVEKDYVEVKKDAEKYLNTESKTDKKNMNE